MDIITLAASRRYTDSSIAGIDGVLAGKNCKIQSVEDITNGHRLTFSWNDDEGVARTSTVDVMDGNSIEEVEVKYASSQSGTTPPVSGWSDNVPTVPDGYYLWTRNTVTFSNGDTNIEYLVGRQGVDGYSPVVTVTDISGGHKVRITDERGNHDFNVMDGLAIDHIEVAYAESSSGTSAPSDPSDWQSTPPEVATGNYLWTRNTTYLKDGTNSVAYLVGLQGAEGISPTVTVTPVSGGHQVTITDKDGDHTFEVDDGVDGADGRDGADGADGFSPIITTEKVGKTTTITIVDATSTKYATILDGVDGKTITNITINTQNHVIVTYSDETTSDAGELIVQSAVMSVNGETGDVVLTLPDVVNVGANLSYDSATNTLSSTATGLQSDWNQTDTTAEDYIKNKPDIPAMQVQSDWNQTDNTKKDYIKNKPTLGTAASKDVPSSGNATTTQVVLGSDTRLSDARNAADVCSWAKAATKPTYTASEVGAIPSTYAPSAASAENQLADKCFVNSSIETATATFRGTYNSIAELNAYSGEKDNNDYAFVKTLDSSSGLYQYDRYKWVPGNPGEWVYEYTINSSGFTQAQLDALNSGITSTCYCGNVSCFGGCTYACAKADIRCGLTDCVGTVTQVKVGSTVYNPTTGVVSLPAYPPDLSNCAGLDKTGTVTSVNVCLNGTSATAVSTSGTLCLNLTPSMSYCTDTRALTTTLGTKTSTAITLPEGIDCTGTLSDISINVYCGTSCKCTVNNNGSICLGSNAFNSTAFCDHDCLVKQTGACGNIDRPLIFREPTWASDSVCPVYYSCGVPFTYNACCGCLRIGDFSCDCCSQVYIRCNCGLVRSGPKGSETDAFFIMKENNCLNNCSLGMGIGSGNINRGIFDYCTTSGASSPTWRWLQYWDSSNEIHNLPICVNCFTRYKNCFVSGCCFCKADNSGYPTIRLIADVTNWWNYCGTSSSISAIGMLGDIYVERISGYMNCDIGKIAVYANYRRSQTSPTGTNDTLTLGLHYQVHFGSNQVCPMMLCDTTNNKKYIALKLMGSGKAYTFNGFINGSILLNTCPELCYTSSTALPTGWEEIISGSVTPASTMCVSCATTATCLGTRNCAQYFWNCAGSDLGDNIKGNIAYMSSSLSGISTGWRFNISQQWSSGDQWRSNLSLPTYNSCNSHAAYRCANSSGTYQAWRELIDSSGCQTICCCLIICDTTCYETNLTIRGKTSCDTTNGFKGPYIKFNNSGADQNACLLFNDYDAYRPGASLSLLGDQTQTWFVAQYINATGNFTSNPPTAANQNCCLVIAPTCCNASAKSTTCWCFYGSGVLCNCDSIMTGYCVNVASPANTCTYIRVKFGSANANAIAQIYNTQARIAKSDSASNAVYLGGTYGALAYAHLGTESSPSTCMWLAFNGWRPMNIFSNTPVSIDCCTKTAPSGVTFTAVPNLTTSSGTITAIDFQCAGTSKCCVTSSGTINLSANAWNTNATISTTTYPGACKTGTVTVSDVDSTCNTEIPIALCTGSTSIGRSNSLSFTYNPHTGCLKAQTLSGTYSQSSSDNCSTVEMDNYCLVFCTKSSTNIVCCVKITSTSISLSNSSKLSNLTTDMLSLQCAEFSCSGISGDHYEINKNGLFLSNIELDTDGLRICCSNIFSCDNTYGWSFNGKANVATEACSVITKNNYCMDYFCGSADRPIMITTAATSSHTETTATIGRSTACPLTFNPATGNLCTTQFVANGYPLKYRQTIDLTSLSTSCFYPVLWNGSEVYESDIEIQSPGYGGSCPYNMNYIHFFERSNGWSDMPKTLYIQNLSRYDNNENLIGCIGYASSDGVYSAIWLRGGYSYYVSANVLLCAKTTNFTYCQSKFTVGTTYCGGTNTCVGIFSYNNTARSNILGTLYANTVCSSDGKLTTCTGTVTQVKVGTTAYDPSSGVISLPAYPTGTLSSVNVSVNGTSGTAITSNGTVTLTNVYGCVNTTTYPGACCTGTVTVLDKSDNSEYYIALCTGTNSIGKGTNDNYKLWFNPATGQLGVHNNNSAYTGILWVETLEGSLSHNAFDITSCVTHSCLSISTGTALTHKYTCVDKHYRKVYTLLCLSCTACMDVGKIYGGIINYSKCTTTLCQWSPQIVMQVAHSVSGCAWNSTCCLDYGGFEGSAFATGTCVVYTIYNRNGSTKLYGVRFLISASY